MSLKSVQNAVTKKLGRQLLTAQKHSPVVLFGAGVVGIVGTVVLATRATLKVEEIVKEAEDKIEQTKEAAEKHSEKYTEKDRKKDLLTVYVQTAVKLGTLYGPTIALGLASLAALTGSHVILTRRNVALTAAYATVERGFKEYRERVLAEVGDEKERELRYGVVEREVAVDTDEGVAVKTIKTFDSNKVSMYARIFDQLCPDWQPSAEKNRMFLKSQQNFANELLHSRGHVFLNEVYDMLGIPRTPSGQIVGWILGKGDDFVDFGVFNLESPGSRDFVNGYEKSVLLDFNVCGTMYDKISFRSTDPMYTADV